MPKQVAIAEIRIDGGTQMRQQIDNQTVDDYANAFKAGADFPAVKIFHDGKDNWLADGFHRWHAAKQAGIEKIYCDVEQGSLRDAILYAVGANHSNGMRRTNGDKRVCVMTLLHDKEWSGRSNNWIARKCFVDQTTVGSYRKQAGQVVESTACEDGKTRKVEGRDGKTYRITKAPRKKAADLHVPPIDEEEIEPPRLEVTPRPPLLKVKAFDDERNLVRALADLVQIVKKTQYKASIDKGRLMHELNEWANDIAEAIEEAEAK